MKVPFFSMFGLYALEMAIKAKIKARVLEPLYVKLLSIFGKQFVRHTAKQF